MALKRVSKDEAAGKVLKGIYSEDANIAIVFQDGTYCGFEVDRGYYGDLNGFEQCEIDRSEFGKHNLITAGFYTQEELDAINKKESMQRAEQDRQYKLQQYERLKKEFGA
jgi:hypothetical protein